MLISFPKLKSKIKYLLIFGLSSPLFLISCIDPYTEVRKSMTESLLPRGAKSSVNSQGKKQDKNQPTAKVLGSELESTYSDIINDSVLGLNGYKKNPKSPQNLYSKEKNYLTEISDASFIPSPDNKYGLSNYWFYYKSLPFMLEEKGSVNFKNEYLSKVSYLEEKIKKYLWENLAPYNSYRNFDAWEGIIKDFNKKTGLKDPQKGFDQTEYEYPGLNKYWPIVEKELPENERANKTLIQKQMLVHDFMFGNGFAKPVNMDVYKHTENLVSADNKSEQIWNYIRYFRDDYYRQTGYKPTQTERHWYSLLELMQRVQRNYKGQYAAGKLIQSLTDFEKYLFNVNDKTKPLTEQIKNNIKPALTDIFNKYIAFFLASAHSSLRKDLVFNIDLGQNVDMQSLAADLIKVYNQKIAPIIWKYNSEVTETEKISPLVKDLDKVFLNEYVYPLMGGIKFEDLDETKTEDGKPNPISVKKWEEWKDNYKEFYGWQYYESILSHPASSGSSSNSQSNQDNSQVAVSNNSESN
ncbi:hypothetical protein [Mesomycoplasma hyopneumoniae]|uniref:hypothetical protein n=1 Tax=Mesomycoplasma hyopneumoniae TaxID=2099 RepID=UPI001371BE1F|nr:hypothetical protein [Mesomycoplasma hyopneumoniae]MXR09985.1 hypothetical protein [Mesomycoplasma hyopneumoniae]